VFRVGKNGMMEDWNDGMMGCAVRYRPLSFIRCPQTLNGEPGTVTYELSVLPHSSTLPSSHPSNIPIFHYSTIPGLTHPSIIPFFPTPEPLNPNHFFTCIAQKSLVMSFS